MLLMMNIIVLYFIYFLTRGKSLANTGDLSEKGVPFLCTEFNKPCSTDEESATDHQFIHPRIVLPDDPCPSGSLPCYAKPTECGKRFVEEDNANKDGLAIDGAHPWHAFLTNSTNKFCGNGALLDEFHALTAAHKVEQYLEKPEEITVYMGVYDSTKLENTQNTKVSKIILHSEFNATTLRNDIAILKLENPIVLGIDQKINTICLPDIEADFVESTCTVAGWGQLNFDDSDAPTTLPKQVRVKIIDYETCKTSFQQSNLLGTNTELYLDEIGELCAGGEAKKDACTQDGGSPLICMDSKSEKLHVAGLVIWGRKCGLPNVYGVYVKVSNYRKWIDDTIEML